MKHLFEQLFNNQLLPEEAQKFLISLYHKGESYEDIATAAKIMREHSIKVDLPKELLENAVDIVGTGGDKSGSFNISTTTSLLLASLGYVVAKHGNRSITSKSGATDVLDALGFNFNLSIDAKKKMLEEVGFCFFPAPEHHPAMKYIMPIRKKIPHRTIFNLLGPLTNPTGAKNYLLGVFDPNYIERVAKALRELGAKKAYIVSSKDGMDEISISANTSYAFLNNGEIEYGEISPREAGFKVAKKEEILGGNAVDNAKITTSIFSGEEKGAKRDIIVLNSAYALLSTDKVRDFQEAKEIVVEGLKSKKALAHLNKMVEVSHKLKDD